MNIKDYKLKRPKEGYNTFEEREYAKWSEVSEWELFYKKQKIGKLFFIGTALNQWGGTLDNPITKIYGFTKTEVFYELAHEHKRTINNNRSL